MDKTAYKKCPLCQANKFGVRIKTYDKKRVLKFDSLVCWNCLADFQKKGNKWQLKRVRSKDEKNPIWKEYKNRTLTIAEWVSVANRS
jgi:hypothetical protein